MHVDFVIIAAVLSTVTGAASPGSYRQNRCYSCMSEIYEQFFENRLDRYFNKPRNFSSQCDGDMDTTNMHTVNCRTICLTIQQDFYIMGQPTGHRIFMRGCALTLARRGLNNHTLSMFDRKDVCREMSASDLFRHERTDSQRIHVCSCLGDRCNASISTSNAQSYYLIILCLVFLFYHF